MNPQIAILFWFYKEVDVCKNRLEIIKKYNPDCKVFGLYGGNEQDADLFKNQLDKYLDDFYTSSEKNPNPKKSSFLKWINGDLELLEWYEERGKILEWDSIFIYQWDLLVFDNINNIFQGITKDQIYLPHYDLINKEVETKWYWTSENDFRHTSNTAPTKPYMRNMFLDFKDLVSKKYDFNKIIPRCIFTTGILTKTFFDKYSKIPKDDIKIGFLEYKIPTYAQIFQLDLYKIDLGESTNNGPINASELEIPKEYIINQLSKSHGYKIFHPYYQAFDKE